MCTAPSSAFRCEVCVLDREVARWLTVLMLVLLVVGMLVWARRPPASSWSVHRRSGPGGRFLAGTSGLRARECSARPARRRSRTVTLVHVHRDAGCGVVDCGADRAAGADDCPVRDRCDDDGLLQGGHCWEVRHREPYGLKNRYSVAGVADSCRRRAVYVGHRSESLDPAGGRRVDRTLEHGRDHPDDRRPRDPAGRVRRGPPSICGRCLCPGGDGEVDILGTTAARRRRLRVGTANATGAERGQDRRWRDQLRAPTLRYKTTPPSETTDSV